MKRTTLAGLALIAMSASFGFMLAGNADRRAEGELEWGAPWTTAAPPSRAASTRSERMPVPGPPRQPSAAAAPGDRRYLVSEAPFLIGGGVDLDAFRRIIGSDAFELQVERLEREMVQDVVASEAGAAYASAIRLQFETLRLELPLERFACGRGLCMGSMQTSGTDAAYQAWWAEFQGSAATPHDVGFDYTAERPDGRQVHRFVFAYDPSIRAVSTRIRR